VPTNKLGGHLRTHSTGPSRGRRRTLTADRIPVAMPTYQDKFGIVSDSAPRFNSLQRKADTGCNWVWDDVVVQNSHHQKSLESFDPTSERHIEERDPPSRRSGKNAYGKLAGNFPTSSRLLSNTEGTEVLCHQQRCYASSRFR
jgi:hypothetical protein